MSRASISACLIVQDEQERLPAALASVAFCDEVIVVDGGSTDDTVALAGAAGATVLERPWRGFAAQRNAAIDAARGDWILEVDADERVSPELRSGIEALLANPPADTDIAVCPLRNRFLGGTLGPSAKYPAYRSRLFRRGRYRHDESLAVHEGLELRELPVVLAGDLEHELAATLGEALRDTWRYARLESERLSPPATPRSYLSGIVLRPAAKLAYRTVVESGWRDGWRGLVKIALDAGSDGLVWSLALLRATRGGRREGQREGPENEPAGHFGSRRAGPPRVLALATDAAAGERAARWLRALGERGVDVGLVSTRSADAAGLHQRVVPRMGPLGLMRALEVERQLRLVDALVPVGPRASALRRLLPGTLRPEIAGLSVALDAASAAALAHAAVGSASGEGRADATAGAGDGEGRADATAGSADG